jgi:DNA invertase Pin-like site-specific DNA recombinase
MRCAVYTRKSSEEGLEQDFNSLDAQHEACLAYIASQKQEGWVAVSERYDDGGYSGGSMNRPGLQELMGAVEDGSVDVIVVYKVDRLTRALSDFAQLVEVFDRKGVSFVSVTQQFNTTTSMGRLTLNVLLSFAQFEREVTAERIRDKIAASKKKGLWMGGTVPLGYDADGRTLKINDAEAETVRLIYRRYVELGSVRDLKSDLDQRGIITKKRISKTGKESGGEPFYRGALYHILKSRIYLGEVTHKGTAYKGQHPAIIEPDLWEAVQRKLAESNRGLKAGLRAKEPSPLRGKLFDAGGTPLTPSHTCKGGRRYRYYLAAEGSPLNQGKMQLRVPAAEIESAVRARVHAFLTGPEELNRHLDLGLDAYGCMMLATALETLQLSPVSWPNLIEKVEAHRSKLVLMLDMEAVKAVLSRVDGFPSDRTPTAPKEPIKLHQPIRLKARASEVLVVAPKGLSPSRPSDPALIKAVARAHRWRELITKGKVTEIEEIAQIESLTPRYVRRILNLAFLAPDIVEAILRGDSPPTLMQQDLQKGVPADWREQREALGIRQNQA